MTGFLMEFVEFTGIEDLYGILGFKCGLLMLGNFYDKCLLLLKRCFLKVISFLIVLFEICFI